MQSEVPRSVLLEVGFYTEGDPEPSQVQVFPWRAGGRPSGRLDPERQGRERKGISGSRCRAPARIHSGGFSDFPGVVLRIHPMSLLRSLVPSPHIAVIGASGGMGRAFLESLASGCPAGTVHALSRSPRRSAENVHHQFIDITEEGSIRAAAEAASRDGPLDLVIVASGILHRDSELQPEKSMRELDPQALYEVFGINAVGPAMVAKHFLPLLRTGHKTVFAALSARVGSISDNRLGGWASYRASKAALNMLLKTLAIEHGRRWPDSVVVTLHPGTVDTTLSKPFSSRVPAERLFAPSQAARYLLGVIDDLTPAATGGFFAWDGTAIEY